LCGIFAAIGFSVGYALEYPTTGILAGILTGVGTYLVWGLTIISKQNFVVIERLGKAYVIYHDGPKILCMPGVLDKIVERNTLQFQELVLYEDETAATIDFKDASAPIDASAWYCIGDPKEKKKDDWEQKVNTHILLWAYAFADPKGRIEELVDGTARPLLQKHSVDNAQVKKNTIATEVVGDKTLTTALKQIGAFLEEEKGLIIRDIKLTEEQRALRRQRLKGQADGEEIEKRAKGWEKAIRNLAKGLDVNPEKAVEVFNTQRGFEVLEGADISFVAPNIDGVQQMIKTADVSRQNRQQQRGQRKS
jgi:hypothetical protein